MKRNILTIGLLLMLLMALTGCKKDSGKKTPKPTEEVTEEPTPEPMHSGVSEEYAGAIRCKDEQGALVWSCGGAMSFFASEGGVGKGDSWEIKGDLESYTVTNGDGVQLFRIYRETTGDGADAKAVYIFESGKIKQEIASLSAGTAEQDGFRIYFLDNRMAFFQNQQTLLIVSMTAKEMTASVPKQDGVVIYRFPVRNFVVNPAEAGTERTVSNDSFFSDASDMESLVYGYGAKELDGIFDRIRKAAYQEWPASYVQITKRRVTEGRSWSEYKASYHEDSVVVNRTDSSAPLVVTEYAFETLSEGTPTVEYYTFRDGFDTLAYTFEADELDEYRTRILDNEMAREKAADAFADGLLPVAFAATDYGYEERGVLSGSSVRYIRYYYTGKVTGSILMKYEQGEFFDLRVYALGDAEGNVYADGVPGADAEESHLILYDYDDYGVCVAERSGAQSVALEYDFTDIAYDGENDTVRHEWQQLMPYLETAPKKVEETKPDDGEEGEEGDEDEDGEDADEDSENADGKEAGDADANGKAADGKNTDGKSTGGTDGGDAS